MNQKERLELAKWVASRTKKGGADEAAVEIFYARGVEVECRDRTIDKLEESTQNGLTLRVYLDNRYSTNSTNDLRKESMEKFIDEAVAMTKYLSEDPYRTLPDPKYYEGLDNSIDLKICDKGYDDISSEQRVKLARDMEDDALSRSDKLVSCSSSFSDGVFESVKVHSNGFDGTRRSSIFQAGVSVGVDDGQGGRPSGYDYRAYRFLKDIPPADTFGKLAVDRALARIGQTKIESGSYDVIIENLARTSVLGALQQPLSGRNLQQKNSCFEGKLGEQIFSENLTVSEDPFIPEALGSQLYDDDGMPRRKRTIIDKGVLKEFLINWYYSRKLGVEPTGGGISNVVFGLGKRSLDEMIKSMERGIFITGFIGGNSNPTTGDFSFGIVGHLVEGGKLAKPINEMNISGNILEFWKHLVEVGNDPHPYSSIMRPSMYFKEVSLSGV
ncbi:MAG: TldD/PmbA family protein [candidate division Zixibacteria bacterium]